MKRQRIEPTIVEGRKYYKVPRIINPFARPKNILVYEKVSKVREAELALFGV